MVEYAGDPIDIPTAKQRELDYKQTDAGCYMYYFNHKDKHYWSVHLSCVNYLCCLHNFCC